MIHCTAVVFNYYHLYPEEPWKSPVRMCPYQVAKISFQTAFLHLVDDHTGDFILTFSITNVITA